MKTWLASLTLLAAGAALSMIFAAKETTAMADDAPKTEPMLAHMVYFSLNESTPANRQKLIAACQKYLADHPGTVFFAVGSPSDLNRPVNDRDWDVGLHVVFKNRAAHDAYQTAEKHIKFIDENKASWKKVRVFDADVTGAGK